MKTLFVLLSFFTVGVCLAQENQSTRNPSDGPFLPEPAINGGLVMALYAPDSDKLNKDRIHEAERYNTAGKSSTKLLNTLNIHNPSIEVHLAPNRSQNGAAVIVAPGGGHKILWVGPEGYDIVPFFAKLGVSTIVLRNRLRVDGYEPTTDALDDTFQSIRIVRANAEKWNLDPNRIGVLGFSAGAELAAPAALFFEEFQKKNQSEKDPLAKTSARPDFVGLVYPGPTPFTKAPETPIPTIVPPSFIVCAGSGDKVHAVWADEYFSPMLKAGVPNLEMHIYGRGGHGGAISPRDGIPFGSWQDRFVEWFKDLGFLDTSGTETKAAKEVAAYAKKMSK
ncbi:MAG: alpha/beta hydrolase fold domain-containing protein [Planctomycetota bacterium]|nr:alpha/beta hydrolase fold domain-containing protein [Planctomycetota bacterium]